MPSLANLPAMGSRRSPVQEYLTVADVAALLKLSEKTVYRLAQRGNVPGFKAGGSWRFRRMDIDDWAAALVGRKSGAPR